METPSAVETPRPWTAGRALLLLVHLVIIGNFLFEIGYAGYMIFGVVKPPDTSGPLFEAALQIPFELMVTRRLYAIEFWIATAGLALYLALTEIGPRMWRLERR